MNGYVQGLERPNDETDWVEKYEINGVKIRRAELMNIKLMV